MPQACFDTLGSIYTKKPSPTGAVDRLPSGCAGQGLTCPEPSFFTSSPGRTTRTPAQPFCFPPGLAQPLGLPGLG